ncbi:hypothetical protein PHYSODRAFT_474251 [Phytophthora sojae]|uniref:HAT C-terminal dimerisation domain-containing protein n=1 Tax=Phytophthora sojae (strain P6497) TaxID=1094619 RepID=G4YPF0_PHYSP|nr:hypothetical protein PHYSODRAFT_474251 [Phytophthora sojae]EGZ27930.1 hypothetical protein PHYSODRAFT_474251 [Phytophthora sojae]|eukprot:XP_009515205.1 hypothetical protein PHYSODRAFT_474251 [Phytophthora sojae]
MLARDYGKTIENCLFLVGDNCSTNRRLATLLGVPLVGCASHRLNLAAQNLLEDFKDELDQVKKLMIKLKGLNQSAKLRFKTKLRPVLSQATRWSSTLCMVNRYMKLLEFIQDDDDLAEYLPPPSANRTLRKLLEDLKKIESVSKELQSESVSIADVRCYFDALIALWPGFATYLGKIYCFYTGVKKRRKTTAPRTVYTLLQAIPPTSNTVERFFSVAKATLGLQLHLLQPATLEMVLFLRVNNALWDANAVNACC